MDKQDVLSKVDIVDVVSEYVELERKGKNYFGVCPFHNDNNPSMSVSIQKQMYKCFSCGAAGDAINFVKEIENISYQEALAKVAKSAGIEYEVNNNYQAINDSYYKIYLDSTKYFVYNLQHTSDGKKYLDYLLNRGFDNDVLETFQIGCSNNELVKLLSNKYKSDELVKTGIVNTSNNLIFNSRIIFPIADGNGNVIAYSGRVINDATPKYLNSPETKYFRKSEVLYNMHLAKSEIKKESSVIITEGFFDVMRLYAHGIKNVVATMGTAFTASHVKMIKEITNSIYICMDSDEAGIKASTTMYNMLAGADTKIYMVSLDGKDPDEFILSLGIDRFKTKLQTAKLYEEYYIDTLIDRFNDMSIAQKEQVLVVVGKFVSNISNQVTKQLINDYVASKTGISVIKQHVNVRSQPVVKRVSDKSVVESYYNVAIEQMDVINKIEQEYLYLMLNSKLAIEKYENEINSLNILQNDEVAMLIKQYYIQNEYNNIIEFFNNSFKDYSEQQRQVILGILKNISSFNIKCDELSVEDYTLRIVVYKYEKRIEEVNKKLLNEPDSATKLKLLKKLNVLIKEKTDIIERRGI